MKRFSVFQGLALSTTAALVATLPPQPVLATQTEITAVRVNSTPRGLQLIFNVQGNTRPPVFTVSRGNSSIADVTQSQLRLPQGGAFRQANPAPGISLVEVSQLDAQTVRVTVNGIAAAPVGEVVRRDPSGGLVMNFFLAQQPAGAATAPPTGQPPSMGQRPSAPPPFIPRAAVPPVGDIAVAPLDPNPDGVNLGSFQRIPRLLLRQAPVREVLALLARAADVNVVFTDGVATAQGVTDPSLLISLDIENESVQNVFNYVLRVSNLQANQVGRTVFVGRFLPPNAQNRIVRTIRLNQMRVFGLAGTVNSLTSVAQTGGSVGLATASGTTTTSGGTTAQTSINRQTTIGSADVQLGAVQLLEQFGANLSDAFIPPAGPDCDAKVNYNVAGVNLQDVCRGRLLRGLEVMGDPRTNTVTLVGTPRKVEMAISLLTQLDVRRRQALINVKFVDVNLLRSNQSNVDFQTNLGRSMFGLIFDATGLTVQEGTRPPTFIDPIIIPPTRDEPFLITVPGISIPGLPAGSIVSDFFFNVVVQIQNGNAKVLTNPTLLVQEGSSAQVNLTQEIFSGIQATTSQDASASGATTQSTTITPIIRQAGVIFNVNVDRIDDNGFLTLNISPEVSAPTGTFSVVFPNVENPSTGTLLSQRRLETGQIRLRDGQTLILSGIIQDQDRSSVVKIPILGDIPLLGRLFRRESNARQRNELIVMVTPKIMDDSQASGFGYQYNPSPQNQRLIQP